MTTATIRRNMQKIMQNNAAVFRTQETLAEGCDLIDECAATYQVGVGEGAPHWGRAGGDPATWREDWEGVERKAVAVVVPGPWASSLQPPKHACCPRRSSTAHHHCRPPTSVPPLPPVASPPSLPPLAGHQAG